MNDPRIAVRDFRALAEELKREVYSFLPTTTAIHPTKANAVFRAYAAVFAPNFIPWLTATYLRCSDYAARDAVYGNLQAELVGNHPGLLLNLVAQLPALDTQEAAARVCSTEAIVNSISVCCQTNAVEGLLILACLENASLAFIPWMKIMAGRLEIADQAYLDVHGDADVAHAASLLNALDAEARALPHNAKQSFIGGVLVSNLLRRIFSALSTRWSTTAWSATS